MSDNNINMNNKYFALIIIFLLLGSSFFTASANFTKINKKSTLDNNFFSEDEDFNEKIRFFMKKTHFPSLVACIIQKDSIDWYGSYGKHDILTRRKPDLDTVYMMASISKSITATAFMQIYEKGLFDLDDDVNDYLDFSLRNPKYPDVNITFRMLLSHQSSLSECDFFDNVILMYVNSKIFPKYPYPFIKEYLTPGGSMYKPSVWLDKKPGETSAYSNFNFAVLEYLFKILKNQSIEEYCKKNIFAPLEMNNTSYDFHDFDRKKMARPYFHLGFFYFPIPHYNPYSAGGGVRSSVQDLSNFFIAHMNGGVYNGTRILNESSVALMHDIQYPDDEDDHDYGLGWMYFDFNGTIFHGHGGSYPGCDTNMLTNLDEEIGIIFVTNKMVQPYRKIEFSAYKSISKLLIEKAFEI